MTPIIHADTDACVDALAEVACPSCGAFLALHSPDVETPDRILATCDECKSWYLLDTPGGELARLPVERYFPEP